MFFLLRVGESIRHHRKEFPLGLRNSRNPVNARLHTDLVDPDSLTERDRDRSRQDLGHDAFVSSDCASVNSDYAPSMH